MYDLDPDLAYSHDDTHEWVLRQLEIRGGKTNLILPHPDQNTWRLMNGFEDRICYEDEDILAIDKPPGVLAHKSTDRGRTSIGVVEIAHYLRPPYIRRANRLDYDTSGLMLFAKNQIADRELHRQFADKAGSGLDKLYLAILDGEFNPEEDPLEVRNLLERDDKNKLTRVTYSADLEVASQKAKEAITYFHPLAVFSDQNGSFRTLTEVTILTGRTHQIRATSQSLGHPVVGDRHYNDRSSTAPRMMLHAYQLNMQHPITDKPLSITAPLPMDFRNFLKPMTFEYFNL